MGLIIDFLMNIYRKYSIYFQGKLFNTVIMFYKYSRTENNKIKSIVYAWKAFFKIKVYKENDKAMAISHLLRDVDIDLSDSGIFIYSIDVFKTLKLRGKVLGNCTIDYEKIVDHPLSDYYINSDSDFASQNNSVLDAIFQYIERLYRLVKDSQIENKEKICGYLQGFKNRKAESLDEALQRILIINQLQWQTGHILVGLGRLDVILDRFLNSEKDKDHIKESLREFCRKLHKYYYVKSNALMGDTGQIIILGGLNPNGSYFHNQLTQMFTEAVSDEGLPDPKILLRVSQEMPDSLWKNIAVGMTANVGSPLVSNDDQVVRRLIEFGYKERDAYGYITSACWEPIPGGAYEQNNILSLNYLEPFNIISKQGHLEEIDSFSVLLKRYCSALKEYISKIESFLSSIKWEQDPLYSMFNDNCREQEKDAAFGGTGYNNYGILTVALANAVNSLINVNTYVFNQKKYTYQKLDKLRRINFKGHAIIQQQLKNSEKYFGRDEELIIRLVNTILSETEKYIKDYRTPLGGKLKFGLSSPHYIMDSTNYPASFDGRKAKEPFAVHISASGSISYTELMNFASKLDYSGAKFNGNVVDFMLSPNFVLNNLLQFAHFLKVSIGNGIYQLQANVVDSKKLIAAKNNPDEFPDLIVRVWGFNAYFRELPEEYQNYLIERALQSERAA